MARRSQTSQTPQLAPAEALALLAQSNAEQVAGNIQGNGFGQTAQNAPAAQAIPAGANDTLARHAATGSIEENDGTHASQTNQAAPARDNMEAVANFVGQQSQVTQHAIQAHRTAQDTPNFQATAMRTYDALVRRDTGAATGGTVQSRSPRGYQGTHDIPVATYAAPAGGRVGQGQSLGPRAVQSQTYGAPVQRGTEAVTSRITQGQGDQGTQAQRDRVVSAGTYAAPARGHVTPVRQRVGAVAGHGQGQDHRGARADQGPLQLRYQAAQIQPQGIPTQQTTGAAAGRVAQIQAPQAAWAPLVLERITHVGRVNGLMHYRVKWVGLDDSQSTWIPEPVVLAHYWPVIVEFLNSFGYYNV
ncbi:hypothetical protein F4806DRAFT_468847 [Annulohypoxylon nitens]|nr:hypothetical protein F4806DRAFT_468847 [Annulohypoxylon nitens]